MVVKPGKRNFIHAIFPKSNHLCFYAKKYKISLYKSKENYKLSLCFTMDLVILNYYEQQN